MKEKIFIFLLIFCFISAGFMPSGIEKAGIIRNATADYVDASHDANESDIVEDPLVPGWSKDVELTKCDGNHSNLVDICVDKNNVLHAVWEDQGDESEYAQIYYSKSENEGITWSEPRRITKVSPNSENRGTPSIDVSENNTLHLVWVHWIPYNREIYYMKSVNSGDTWSDDIKLTDTTECSVTPRIGCYKNTVHLVWIEGLDHGQLYYIKSMDDGESWNSPIKLTNLSGDCGSPSLYVTPINTLHVVWQYKEKKEDYNIYYIKSDDGGEKWSSIIRITNDPNGVSGPYPNPEITGTPDGNLHVAWRDTTSPETIADIAYSKSYNFGDNWTESIMLTSDSILTKNGNAGMPHITSDAYSNLYIVWKSTNHTIENGSWIADSNDVYFIYSKDGGESWEDIIRLTYASGWGRNNPRVIIDSKGIAHIVWGDGRHPESYEIIYKRSLCSITEPHITVTQSLNVSACKPKNSITVSGNAVYNDSIVPNANVSIKILETGDEWNTTTNTSGDYSKTITAPDIPGNYTIRVTVTSGNHTGWKQMKLTVEQESTNGGTTNGDGTNGGTTNGGQQPGDEENKYGINLNYMIGIVAVVAICVIIGVALVKHKGKQSAKLKEEKKPTQMLRCPKCKKTFRVELKPKPFSVKCPHCGKEGTIK